MREVFQIKLDILDIGDFIEQANKLVNDVNLVQGYSLVSGKSIMGVMSLDLKKPIKLIVRDRDNDDIVYDYFRKWLIQEEV